VVDKLAEHPMQINTSPYACAGNNPISRIDADGNCWPCWVLEGLAIVAEGAAASEVIAAGGAMIGTAIVVNGINQLNINSRDSDQDNISSPQVLIKTVSDTNKPSRERILDATKDKGSIYKVPGSSTDSGKPYIGRHNKPNPQKTRKSKDGRDRKKLK